MSSLSQCKMILDSLLSGTKLTQLDAYDQFGCVRLPARINDLRNNGHIINTEMVTRKNRFGKSSTFAEYSISNQQLGLFNG